MGGSFNKLQMRVGGARDRGIERMREIEQDKAEAKRFMNDCKLWSEKLTKTEFDLLFIRVNWSGPMDGVEKEKTNDP